jgi:hypothetical protein
MTLKQIFYKTKNYLPLISLGLNINSIIVFILERNAKLNQENNEISRLSNDLKRNKDVII